VSNVIQLYTANHDSELGISDLIELLLLTASHMGVDIQTSNALSSECIIFIDEFSSIYEVKRLIKAKQKKKLKYILISTEFETNTCNGASFNEFNESDKKIAYLINLLSFILFLTPKCARSSIFIGRFSALIMLIFMLPKLFLTPLTGFSQIIDRVKTFKRAVYMKSRRKGYDRFKDYVDLRIKIHPLLNENENELIIYPLIEGSKIPRNTNIKVSGTQTGYRLTKCDNFVDSLKIFNKKYIFNYSGQIKFDSELKSKAFGFAYQPAQSKDWDKSNPIKIWRDYYFHDSIPIVDNKFNDHPIEDIAITTKEFLSTNFNKNTMESKQLAYVALAIRSNKLVFERVKSLTLK
jgi:hypothetical protein